MWEHSTTDLDVQEPEQAQSSRCKWRTKTQVETNNVSPTFALQGGWKIKVYSDLDSGLAEWTVLTRQDNLFTSGAYLKLLARLDLGGVQNGLAVFHHEQRGCFGVILQVFSFSAREQLGNLDQEQDRNTWQKMRESVRRGVASLLNFRVLTAGQLLFTGEQHGLTGLDQCDLDDPQELAEILNEGLDSAMRSWPEHVHGLLLKDLPLGATPQKLGFHPLPVQPNMVLPINADWQSFTDYTGAMSSKYRVRARRARKKGQALTRRTLDATDLVNYEGQMYRLFRKIADQSDFNAVELPSDYFRQWATHFAEAVEIVGYFVAEELVGFTTTIRNGKELEAHYLGLDAKYNPSHQLYLNMLYDMVEKAIDLEVHELVLSRTALEIKSSIGATPQDIPCWLRGRRRLSSSLIPFFAPYVAPPVVWTQRHPFK